MWWPQRDTNPFVLWNSAGLYVLPKLICELFADSLIGGSDQGPATTYRQTGTWSFRSRSETQPDPSSSRLPPIRQVTGERLRSSPHAPAGCVGLPRSP